MNEALTALEASIRTALCIADGAPVDRAGEAASRDAVAGVLFDPSERQLMERLEPRSQQKPTNWRGRRLRRRVAEVDTKGAVWLRARAGVAAGAG